MSKVESKSVTKIDCLQPAALPAPISLSVSPITYYTAREKISKLKFGLSYFWKCCIYIFEKFKIEIETQ